MPYSISSKHGIYLLHMMNQKIQTAFFFSLFGIALIFTVLIFWPFLVPLIMAGVLGVILKPVFTWILERVGEKRRGIAAVSTIIVFLVVIIFPLTLIGNKLVDESQSLYALLSGESQSFSLDMATTKIESYIQEWVPAFKLDSRQFFANISGWFIGSLGGLFSGTLDFLIKFVITIIALYFVLKDGIQLKKQLVMMSPLTDAEDMTIINSLQSAIRAVITGSLFVALIQGLLTGLGFLLTGVPNPTFWGTVATIAALVPGLGTALVIFPGVIYLFFFGGAYAWIVLLVWGIVAVGLIDNIVGPKIMGRGIDIHPVLILFSILGGLSFFGPEGFIFGPVIITFLFVLVKVFKSQSQK